MMTTSGHWLSCLPEETFNDRGPEPKKHEHFYGDSTTAKTSTDFRLAFVPVFSAPFVQGVEV
jgi:hypothetical protein